MSEYCSPLDLTQIEQNFAELVSAECRMLQLACAWADAHYLDSDSDEYQPLIQRACAWGR